MKKRNKNVKLEKSLFIIIEELRKYLYGNPIEKSFDIKTYDELEEMYKNLKDIYEVI